MERDPEEPARDAGGFAPGSLFQGRYEIVRRIAGGGMGSVYECLHVGTRRRRALKVMLPQIVSDARSRARFELEARITAEIETEHIVETFDAGIDEATGSPFLVMELLKGEDFASLLKRKGPLSPSAVVALLSQVARALDKTHAAGIVHRDLKPENLFLTMREDDTPRVKILDFGIAKVAAESTKGQATGLIGTPLYMSPEQIEAEAEIGPPSDRYALGHIAYTLLTGRAYWDEEHRACANVYAFLVKVVRGIGEPASARATRRGVALPAAFDAWFERAASKDPAARHPTAAALVDELAAALEVSEAIPGHSSPSAVSSPSTLSSPSSASLSASQEDRQRLESAPTITPAPAPVALPHSGGSGSREPTDTATPVATDRLRAATGHRPKVFAMAALGVVVVVGLLAFSTGSGEAPRSTVESSRSLGSSGAPDRSPDRSPDPTADPTARTELSRPIEATSLPTPTEPVASARPGGSAASGSASPSSSAARRPTVGVPNTSETAEPAASSSARARCNPPYFFDAAGDKRIKPECD